MALNCVLLKGLEPIPIPGEKILLSVPGTQLCILKTSTCPELKANGTTHVSNKRLVFVSSSCSPPDSNSHLAASDTPVRTDVLNTFTVPIDKFQDGRFQQPIFSAPYWEAKVIPVQHGGLQSIRDVTISFKEGQGWQFYEIVEEVKAREGEASASTNAAEEDLPKYEPPPSFDEPPPMFSEHPPSPAIAHPLPSSAPSTSQSTSRRPPPRRQSTLPDDDSLEAASVARQQEEWERENDTRDQRPPEYS